MRLKTSNHKFLSLKKCHTPPLFTSFINLVYIPAMLIAPVFFIPNESFFGFCLKKFMQITLWSSVTPSLNNETKLSAPSLKSKLWKVVHYDENLNFREKTQIKTTLYLNWCRNSKILKISLLQCISYIYIMPGWWCNRTQIRLTERFLLSLHPPLKRSAKIPKILKKITWYFFSPRIYNCNIVIKHKNDYY